MEYLTTLQAYVWSLEGDAPAESLVDAGYKHLESAEALLGSFASCLDEIPASSPLIDLSRCLVVTDAAITAAREALTLHGDVEPAGEITAGPAECLGRTHVGYVGSLGLLSDEDHATCIGEVGVALITWGTEGVSLLQEAHDVLEKTRDPRIVPDRRAALDEEPRIRAEHARTRAGHLYPSSG